MLTLCYSNISKTIKEKIFVGFSSIARNKAGIDYRMTKIGVQRAWYKTGFPKIHGWVFDVKTGKLIDLKLNAAAVSALDILEQNWETIKRQMDVNVGGYFN